MSRGLLSKLCVIAVITRNVYYFMKIEQPLHCDQEKNNGFGGYLPMEKHPYHPTLYPTNIFLLQLSYLYQF